MTGRSFRSQHLKELVKHQKTDFYIELAFIKHGVEQSLRMSYDGKERKIHYNNTPCSSITGLIGVIPGTIMIPDDVSMIKGAPALRRKYLDMQLAQSDPLYVHHLTRFHRALRYRNVLLKEKRLEAMDVWEQELAGAASYISAKRYQILVDLQRKCCGILSELSGKAESIQLKYRSQCPEERDDKKTYYSDLYKKMRTRELHFGLSLVGPHKDDMQILIDDKDARHFSSEGQQRSCVAALRFAEWECLRQLADVNPLMMIDDLGISLDVARRSKLMEQLSYLNQVFLTTTEEDNLFPLRAAKDPRVIRLT